MFAYVLSVLASVCMCLLIKEVDGFHEQIQRRDIFSETAEMQTVKKKYTTKN